MGSVFMTTLDLLLLSTSSAYASEVQFLRECHHCFGYNAAEQAQDEAGEDAQRTVKPLEEEPLLAARIVIEDCMCLLLDVDDIDRVWTASAGMREDEHVLRQRRSLLMDAFASSLRLPDGALPPAGGRASDAVFVRLMGLHKGRSLLARAMKYASSVTLNPF